MIFVNSYFENTEIQVVIELTGSFDNSVCGVLLQGAVSSATGAASALEQIIMEVTTMIERTDDNPFTARRSSIMECFSKVKKLAIKPALRGSRKIKLSSSLAEAIFFCFLGGDGGPPSSLSSKLL